MIFRMGGKVERESRLRKKQPGTKWSALERAAHEADCLELLSRRQAVRQKIRQVAKKAKTWIQTEDLASLDFATCIHDTIHMLTSRSLDQYQHAGPPPLKRVPRALTHDHNGFLAVSMNRNIPQRFAVFFFARKS